MRNSFPSCSHSSWQTGDSAPSYTLNSHLQANIAAVRMNWALLILRAKLANAARDISVTILNGTGKPVFRETVLSTGYVGRVECVCAWIASYVRIQVIREIVKWLCSKRCFLSNGDFISTYYNHLIPHHSRYSHRLYIYLYSFISSYHRIHILSHP